MKKKLLITLLSVLMLIACAIGFAACDSGHEHPYSAEWSCDDTYHWHACTAETCDKVKDKAKHTWDDGVCSVCQRKKPSEGLEYSWDRYNISYSLTGIGTCTDTDIIIPSEYEDLPVTSIEEDAFYNCSSLTSITIPDSVTNIGEYAFYNCLSLMTVTIGNSVKDIANYAFCNCGSLTNITIPDSVTSIGWQTFEGCTAIETATIPTMAIGSITNSGKDINLKTVISTSGESIGDSAFEGCSSLTTVTIPDSVTNIGERAFSACNGLTSITIPDSVTNIGDSTFSGCNGLTSVTFENTTGWWYAFRISASSGTSISSSSLANTSTAATYLTDTYVSYYWKTQLTFI